MTEKQLPSSSAHFSETYNVGVAFQLESAKITSGIHNISILTINNNRRLFDTVGYFKTKRIDAQI